MSTVELPLFPLNALLMPSCKMPLQIFEKRYLDMVSRCMRSNSGFVVALLKPGTEHHEVITPDLERTSETLPFYTVGTEALIVDFEQRANGLLGIMIAGQQRMELSGAHQQSDGLWLAHCSPKLEQTQATPDDLATVASLMSQLMDYPDFAYLQGAVDLKNDEQIMNYLIMFLPLPAPIKQELLEIDQHRARWHALRQLLFAE